MVLLYIDEKYLENKLIEEQQAKNLANVVV
jgi:hypothetical protein